jgi:hypothetical protein
LNDYLRPQAARVELICTENNSVSTRPGKQTTNLVNGLFYADSFGQVLQTEFNGFVWWIFRNGRETNNNNSNLLYGWRQYGDYGMVSDQNEPHPAYYASKLVSNFASEGDQVVSANSDYNLLSVYAVKRANGAAALLVINKNRATGLNARINLTGLSPQPNATIYSYGLPQDEAARTGTGSPDIAVSAFAGASSNFNYTFPPYSATVIAFAPGNANCSYSISESARKFKRVGGTGNLSVACDAGCGWQAASDADWLTITSGHTGTGSGAVSYTQHLRRKAEGSNNHSRAGFQSYTEKMIDGCAAQVRTRDSIAPIR